MDPSYVYCAVSFYTGGCYILFYRVILGDLGAINAARRNAVFASGTFGAFASPLSDNTVTTCTVLGIDVVKYARSKLVPALIAAGISVVLYGAFSFFR